MIDQEIKKCKLAVVVLLLNLACNSGICVLGIAFGSVVHAVIGALCVIVGGVCVYRLIGVIEQNAKLSEKESYLFVEER